MNREDSNQNVQNGSELLYGMEADCPQSTNAESADTVGSIDIERNADVEAVSFQRKIPIEYQVNYFDCKGYTNCLHLVGGFRRAQ